MNYDDAAAERRAGGWAQGEGSARSSRPCEESCQAILSAIGRAETSGQLVTIAEVADATGLSLAETFAALRTLEFAKVVRIADNPIDPFAARLTLRDGAEAALERWTERSVQKGASPAKNRRYMGASPRERP